MLLEWWARLSQEVSVALQECFMGNLHWEWSGIIQLWNYGHLGWKRSLGSLSPTMQIHLYVMSLHGTSTLPNPSRICWWDHTLVCPTATKLQSCSKCCKLHQGSKKEQLIHQESHIPATRSCQDLPYPNWAWLQDRLQSHLWKALCIKMWALGFFWGLF